MVHVDTVKEAWKRRRKTTTILSTIYVFSLSAETSFLAVSLVYYLRDDFQLKENLSVYYSILMGIRVISEVLGCLIVPYIHDKTLNIRLIVLTNLILGIAANFIYLFPSMPSLLFISKFLVGFTESMHSTLCGKIFFRTFA